MAGTVVETHERKGPIGVVEFTCTGDSSDGSFPQHELTTKISGQLLALETNPGATAPTSNYDVALNDAEGLDVLHSQGANRHTSTTEKVSIVFGTYFHPPVSWDDTLTLAITGNSVASAGIVVRLYYLADP